MADDVLAPNPAPVASAPSPSAQSPEESTKAAEPEKSWFQSKTIQGILANGLMKIGAIAGISFSEEAYAQLTSILLLLLSFLADQFGIVGRLTAKKNVR